MSVHQWQNIFKKVFLISETNIFEMFSLGCFANCPTKQAKSLPKGFMKNNMISIIDVKYSYNNCLVK